MKSAKQKVTYTAELPETVVEADVSNLEWKAPAVTNVSLSPMSIRVSTPLIDLKEYWFCILLN